MGNFSSTSSSTCGKLTQQNKQGYLACIKRYILSYDCPKQIQSITGEYRAQILENIDFLIEYNINLWSERENTMYQSILKNYQALLENQNTRLKNQLKF